MNTSPRSSPDRLIISLENRQVDPIVALYSNPTTKRLNLEFKLAQIQGREQAFFQGLQTLIDLGLVSESELRRQCQAQLICPLPTPAVAAAPAKPTETRSTATSLTPVTPTSTRPALAPVVAPPPSVKDRTRDPTLERTPASVEPDRPPLSWPPVIERILGMGQALVAEISVIWLLALGVFLVVLSSAALALTQWQTFPPTGQYGVLWAYTLGFAGAGLWTQGKDRLALTSQGLRFTALLLLPLNLWAIEGLQLWRFGSGWIVMAVALGSLGAMGWPLLRLQGVSRLGAGVFGLLCLLQLGWILPGMGVLAPYGGVLVGGWGLLREPLGRRTHAEDLRRVGGWWGWGVILFGSGLLIARGGILQGFQSLGLALLIWGLLLSRGLPGEWRWRMPLISLGLTWGITVGSQPAQALVISGIGLGVLWFRLTQSWRLWDLLLLLAVGGQGLILIGRVLPVPLGLAMANLFLTLGIPVWGPEVLSGSVYSWGILALARWLKTQDQPRLVRWCEGIAASLGILLLAYGTVDPSLPSLQLAAFTLFTLTTGIWWGLHRQRRDLIFVLHGSGLVTGLIWLDSVYPQLRSQPQIWGSLLLIGLGVEWGWRGWRAWGQAWADSAWVWGWGLAVASGGLMVIHGFSPERDLWVMLWWITPALLLWRAQREPRSASATPILITLLGAQSLWIGQPQWGSLALGISAGLALWTSWIYPLFAAALLQIGFTLGAWGLGLWQGWDLTQADWSVNLAGVGNGLLLGAGYLDRLWHRAWEDRSLALAAAYRGACHLWAGILTLGLFGLLSIRSVQILMEPVSFAPAAWGLIWLLTPVTLLARTWDQPAERRSRWAVLGILTLGLGHLLWLPFAGVRVLGVGAAAILLGIWLGRCPTLPLALIQIGVTLEGMALGLFEAGVMDERVWIFCLAGIGLLLWSGREWVRGRTGALAQIYGDALEGWGILLLSWTGVLLTWQTAILYTEITEPDLWLTGATLVGMLTLGICSWRGRGLWLLWGWIWGIELLTAQGVAAISPDPSTLSGVTMALGVLAQFTKRWWLGRFAFASSPWHGTMISLTFGLLGVLLRVGVLEPWTGISTLGLALIVMEIGRGESENRWWVHLGWIGAAVGTAEFLWAQTIEFSAVERVLLLSALGTLWSYGTQALALPLSRYLQLPRNTIQIYAHGHWIAATGLWILGIGGGLSSYTFGVGSGILLASYALFQGRRGTESRSGSGAKSSVSPSPAPASTHLPEIWTSMGLIQGLIWVGINLSLLPELWQAILIPWLAGLSLFPAALFYRAPWSSWGWPHRPWRILGGSLPLALTLITFNAVTLPSVAIGAGFYLLLAYWDRNWRWTDLSLAMVTGVIWKVGLTLGISSSFVYLGPIGFSLLWISHTEPAWQGATSRALRHRIRLGGLSLILLPALFSQPWGVTILLSLTALLTGLALKIRAYLLLGTGIFLISTLQQASLLVISNSFSRWSGLLILGLALILGAATFESYRTKLKDLWVTLMGEMQTWD